VVEEEAGRRQATLCERRDRESNGEGSSGWVHLATDEYSKHGNPPQRPKTPPINASISWRKQKWAQWRASVPPRFELHASVLQLLG